MALQLMLAASLRKYVAGYNGETGHLMRVEPGATIRDLARLLAIPEEEVKLIMVDGLAAQWETTLSGDERVALFPPIGGG
ncbi:MAG: MoaD/ThiS family protein [Syntrophobacteraceae bacterium]